MWSGHEAIGRAPIPPSPTAVEAFDPLPGEPTDPMVFRPPAPTAFVRVPARPAPAPGWEHLLERGRAHLFDGDLVAGTRAMVKALHHTGDPDAQRLIYAQLADAYTQAGDLDEARYYARRAAAGRRELARRS